MPKKFITQREAEELCAKRTTLDAQLRALMGRDKQASRSSGNDTLGILDGQEPSEDVLKAQLRDIVAILDQDHRIVMLPTSVGCVQIGSRVTLLVTKDGEASTTEKYTISGWDQGDPEKGILSYNSPCGDMIMDTAVGEEAYSKALRTTVTILRIELPVSNNVTRLGCRTAQAA